jgi:hypothetical protein
MKLTDTITINQETNKYIIASLTLLELIYLKMTLYQIFSISFFE